MNRFIEPVSSDVLSVLRQARTLRSADLLARLRLSRPTLSRATMMRIVKVLGSQIVVRGAARNTTYAARRSVRGMTGPIPVYRVDEKGAVGQIAELDPIYPEGCALRYGAAPEWPLAPEMRDGWFPGLPYIFEDMRPQGFLGRNLAHNLADVLQVRPDPRRWQEDDVLYVLSTLGSDCSGNYILGAAACQLHLDKVQQGYDSIDDAMLPDAYPEQALRAMAYGAAGPSAGGEFPKFTVFRRSAGRRFHVLVKFSGADDSPAARRTADLLVCEHLALQAVERDLELPAARSCIHQFAGRTFLEVERFDRHGEFGRSPVCTWGALEAALFGMGGASWPAVAARLHLERFVGERTRDAIAALWHFGRLIANSDMHEGNLAFLPSAQGAPLALAPVYDMLPMLYGPVSGGELPARRFAPALPLPGEREAWLRAAHSAAAYWEGAAADSRISDQFRLHCAANAEEVRRLAA